MGSQLITKVFPQLCDLLPLTQAFPQRYPFFLESVAKQANNARFNVLFAFPQQSLVLDHAFRLHEKGVETGGVSFLAALDNWFGREKIAATDSDGLPFRGGWFVYLGYELAQQIEPTLHLPPGDARVPVALATRVPAAIIQDTFAQTTSVVVEAEYESLMPQLLQDFESISLLPQTASLPEIESIDEDPVSNYLSQVATIKDYILAGDVFQVNLSRRWRARVSDNIQAVSLYRKLRRANPAPFAGLAMLDYGAIVSSSPERLISRKGNVIQTRPIAGTRRRTRAANGNFTSELDARQTSELVGHPKERAEHIMLIDLERNDLGRVCIAGSVKVDELMAIESYEHVHHIVSNVRGNVVDGTTPGDIIAAVFPGGTITGCPKVRCMEILAELEQAPRHAYTGSMGYLNRDGDMDLNILIRTLMVQDKEIIFRAGGGIVADSDPTKELEETRAKAQGMLNAIVT